MLTSVKWERGQLTIKCSELGRGQLIINCSEQGEDNLSLSAVN